MPNNWNTIQSKVVYDLKRARHRLWLNVAAYLVLFIIEYVLANIGHSNVLRADAFNNLSGILGTGLLITGLIIAARTHDEDLFGAPISEAEQRSLGPRIQQSRFRFETVYTLVSGLIMAAIAIDIIYKGIISLSHQASAKTPTPITGIGAAISGIILLGLYFYNKYSSVKLNNATLSAAAKDILGDTLTSFATTISIFGSILFQLKWLDGVASMLIGLYILNSGITIFRESSLKLVDYFDPNLEAAYQQALIQVAGVKDIIFLKAHYDGSLIMLDVTVVVDSNMTAQEIYQLTNNINDLMQAKFGVTQTDVMIHPDQIVFSK
ncbi:cation diffusion facilitator family transporter [Agrilactobacillus yilanensis]|uniref:Cation diffusion facilitator family transporter n=1 Tax=Agrilactobacillus yilanensis TaxID=2485997 RepID=A0ABW4J2Z5_9LACO|nr:cation diffusion facilitator family transporter [Agrilactobacillus yilanensis]